MAERVGADRMTTTADRLKAAHEDASRETLRCALLDSDRLQQAWKERAEKAEAAKADHTLWKQRFASEQMAHQRTKVERNRMEKQVATLRAQVTSLEADNERLRGQV